jgi:hypothetical protein
MGWGCKDRDESQESNQVIENQVQPKMLTMKGDAQGQMKRKNS